MSQGKIKIILDCPNARVFCYWPDRHFKFHQMGILWTMVVAFHVQKLNINCSHLYPKRKLTNKLIDHVDNVHEMDRLDVYKGQCVCFNLMREKSGNFMFLVVCPTIGQHWDGNVSMGGHLVNRVVST